MYPTYQISFVDAASLLSCEVYRRCREVCARTEKHGLGSFAYHGKRHGGIPTHQCRGVHGDLDYLRIMCVELCMKADESIWVSAADETEQRGTSWETCVEKQKAKAKGGSAPSSIMLAIPPYSQSLPLLPCPPHLPPPGKRNSNISQFKRRRPRENETGYRTQALVSVLPPSCVATIRSINHLRLRVADVGDDVGWHLATPPLIACDLTTT